MRRRLAQATVVFVVIFAAAQLVRPSPANPPTDGTRTIQADETTKGLTTVLDRSCGDCHSNATVWSSWYTQIAPLSWLMAHEVTKGRQAVNFSEWAEYSAAKQRILLAASCNDAKSGKMPGPYTFFKPETRLSGQDVETICAAARQTEAKATGASQ
ncbi:MAG TPA: heme-binding domain-containing protein [Vicinamibacterales bacterium]|nr:heme-binding domain-containing protein [Vicinamibacterales bacterium]